MMGFIDFEFKMDDIKKHQPPLRGPLILVSGDSLSYCQDHANKMEDYFHRLKPNWVELESENNLFSEIK